MAESARAYARNLDYGGTSAPADAAYAMPAPQTAPQAAPAPAPRAKPAPKSTYSISAVAIVGALAVFVLMIFLMLAHVYHTGMNTQTVRLNAQLNELTEQQRRLEIDFESAVDMGFIYRYARDVLGMSRPDGDQVFIVQSAPQDRAQVLYAGDDENGLRQFGSFLSSLLEYFR